ncbi:uncharacterized protein LOC115874224 [Sitophilus oryzae]|uniref:Uncharacterized protein LOC115874224 n=1 Tax=Sitophilus oryzae TaxID=7048 RepID=A0A6J2X1W4_SITOR|nr:uncharacterized protein LOC115874224 [Sitophilus oryzae]
MDGHTTHTKNLEAITLARENGIIMMSLPAHTTDGMQPCDISFFKPLSSYYNQAADKWLRANHSQYITQFQVSRLLGEAYAIAASVGNAVSGFAKWPLDPNVFDDSEFVSLPSDNMDCINTLKDQIEPKTQAVAQEVSTSVNSRLESPSTSTLEESVEAECSTSSLQKFKSVSEISPMPVLRRKTRTVTSNGTALLTSTPYKENLEEQRKKVVRSKTIRSVFSSAKGTTKGKSSASAQKTRKRHRPLLRPQESSSESDNEDSLCIVCIYPFSQSIPGEEWIRCTSCKKWAHLKCTNGRNSIFYWCINCESDRSDSD